MSTTKPAEWTWIDTGHLILGNLGVCVNCGLADDDALPETCAKNISDARRAELADELDECMKEGAE